jgi:HAD superfamily hydrolase (TIGR01509 family)
MAPAAILDLDGTLVDTNYHHALAWYRAFRQNGLVLPLWRIHRAVGMGGDKFVAALAGDEVEKEQGEDIRAAEKVLYLELIEETEPLAGARGLIAELKGRGHTVVLASSAKEHELDYYLDRLDVRELADGWTSSADVKATKPDPDLVLAALEQAGTREAVMVGDTGWDVEAARGTGIETICVMTGGWSAQELRDAGAVAVYESIAELRENLDRTPLSPTGKPGFPREPPPEVTRASRGSLRRAQPGSARKERG